MPPAAAPVQSFVPGLPLRVAVMIYEALLLFGVAFIVSYALLAALQWSYPLAAQQRWVLQAVLFVAFGIYFVYCWTRSGQTLAMKSWQLRLVGRDGRPPPLRVAVLRYLLAWTLLAPGFVFVALFHTLAAWDALAFVLGFLAMLLVARTNTDRQLLHDHLLGTRVIRERSKPT